MEEGGRKPPLPLAAPNRLVLGLRRRRICFWVVPNLAPTDAVDSQSGQAEGDGRERKKNLFSPPPPPPLSCYPAGAPTLCPSIKKNFRRDEKSVVRGALKSGCRRAGWVSPSEFANNSCGTCVLPPLKRALALPSSKPREEEIAL